LAYNLREAIKRIAGKNKLLEVEQRVDPKYEIAYITRHLEKKYAVLFKNIREKTGRVITGIYGDKERLAIALDMKDEKELLQRFSKAMDSPMPTKLISNAPVHEVEREIDVRKLPIPTFYERDMGPYITAGIFIAKDKETGARNASYHRMTPISKNKFAVRIVERDLYLFMKKAHEKGERLEVAVVIGVDPATAISASTTLPLYHDELQVAASLLGGGLRTVKGKTVDVEYPADAELVLEGYFEPNETTKEGPFVDILGTYDLIREQPVFTVTAIYSRKDPIFHAILPGGYEHKTLMGFPREVRIYKHVTEVIPVNDVYLTSWGSGWLECVISVNKRHPDEPINAGLAAFAAHTSLKKVILVDKDINIYDAEDVYWAVITRAHPVRDYIIIPRGKGSSLDMTGKPNARIIIDATIKEKRELFERARIPESENSKRILDYFREKI